MIKLLLPIFFPSWRFFSSIGPSPRFDFGFIRFTDEQPETWQEFSVLPDKITHKEGIARLFHNPEWNERLYINTCAENLVDQYSEFREQEIARRILWILNRQNRLPEAYPYFCYRIRVITNEGNLVKDEVVFSAKPFLVKRGMQS
jgi:hypothetical protein